MLLRRASLVLWPAVLLAAVLLAAVLLTAVLPASAAGQAPTAAVAAPAASADAAPLTREAVDAAAAGLRADPRLQASRFERTLRIKPDDEAPSQSTPGWFSWLVGAAAWLNETGRFLVWALGALAVALLALRLRRLWRAGADQRLAGRLHLPTHVSQLDIRPQTLPADIGAEAAALWQAGRKLDAMSLLYRGALSQLVHAWAVPIRSSSTEGDCLRLARPQLPADAHRYLATLVSAWRSTVYAGRPPTDDLALQLCAGFGAGLAGPAMAPSS